MNPSKLKINTWNWCEVQESVCNQVIGFGFTSNWMKKWLTCNIVESITLSLLFDLTLCFSNTVTSHSIGCWPVIYCMVFTVWSLCSDDDGGWLHYFTWVYIRRYWAKGQDIQTTDQPSKFSVLWVSGLFWPTQYCLR